MQDAFAHCEALVRAADQDRALATVFAPAEHRRALYALYAFNIEIARVRGAVKEPLAGEVRLQWWREVAAGERAEEARGHPVASALVETMRRYDLPLRPFEEMIEGRHRELEGPPLGAELEDYCRQTSSTVMDLAGRILGGGGRDFAGPAGIAYAMARLFRAKAHQDDLRGQAARSYEQALPLIAAAPAAVAAAWLPVALVPLYLEARGHPANEVSALRRTWTLWRALRRGRPVAL